MKLRYTNESKNLVLNQDQSFKTDLGWLNSFEKYEQELLYEIINPIENYETSRYIHKPYTSSNNINQTDIWFYFYFLDSNGLHTNGLDYSYQGLNQSAEISADLKNSFFRLEFYKTNNNEAPNRSNRRLVFAKNLSVPVGEKVTLSGESSFRYVPVFTGSNYKNKENMYLFWFEDDTVLEETTLTGGTFFMTAKFYNALNGDKIQFANKSISSANLVEEDDLYFEVFMDRSNAPSYNYDVSDYDSTGNVRGNRRGTSDSPIKFYEVGGNVGSGNTPTPSPSSTTALTPTPSPTYTPTPTPSQTNSSSITWSNGTSNTLSSYLPGDNPSTGTTTGTLTITGGVYTINVQSYKAFNYDNTAYSTLTIGNQTISVTNPSGGSTTVTSVGSLSIGTGVYTYTITSVLQINSPLTSGMMISSILVS